MSKRLSPFLKHDPERDGYWKITYDEFRKFVEHVTNEKDWNVLNKSLLVKGFQKEWAKLPMFISWDDLNKMRGGKI